MNICILFAALTTGCVVLDGMGFVQDNSVPLDSKELTKFATESSHETSFVTCPFSFQFFVLIFRGEMCQ
jgi:hypothetical protein